MPQPNINAGASTMFSTTVAVCTIIPGLKSPIPRSAAAVATIANCPASDGMNQVRYSPASRAVSGSADCARAKRPRSAIITTKNTTPTTSDSTCDWLKTRRAASRSLRPVACAISAVVPTPSICVSASTKNIRLPDRLTAATAVLPSMPTNFRSTRK